jgi:hypothetical protein
MEDVRKREFEQVLRTLEGNEFQPSNAAQNSGAATQYAVPALQRSA